MRPEYLPIPRTEPLKYCRSFPCAQLSIRIHRGHQYRRILVVFLLFGSKALDVDIDVARKDDMICVIYQYYLTGKMTALALIDLKMKIGKIEKADLGQQLALLPLILSPHSQDLFRVGRRVLCQYLADVYIRSVQRIFFTEAVPSLTLRTQAGGALFACQHTVK